MAPPPPSTSDEHAPPRRTFRSTLMAGTVALLPLCLVGFLAGVQDRSTQPPPRAATSAPPPFTRALTPPATRSSTAAAADEADSAPSAPRTNLVLLQAPVDVPSDAASRPVPQAGRQVLRCTERGRVTYRDLQAGCPEGVGEAVTVFPTQGVEKFK